MKFASIIVASQQQKHRDVSSGSSLTFKLLEKVIFRSVNERQFGSNFD
jgi:hypothetical protein